MIRSSTRAPRPTRNRSGAAPNRSRDNRRIHACAGKVPRQRSSPITSSNTKKGHHRGKRILGPGSWQGLDVAARCLLLSRLLRDSLPNWGPRRRESSMSKPGLDGRHRNKDGEISGKHGNTLVRTLRKVYGQGFAAGYPETAKLSEEMFHYNETSLTQLGRDQEPDHLEHRMAQASK